MDIAKRIDGIPVVGSTADRATMFPSPQVNQRVYNLETDRFERFDETNAWVQDGTTFGTLTVTEDTAALQDVTATRGTFSDLVTVTVNGKTMKFNGLAAAVNALVAGGWIAGHTDGLNITPNDDGVSGKKLVLGYYSGTLYRSAIEYANTTSDALTTITITPPTTFLDAVAFSTGVITSTLRVSGGPSTKASNATGSAGEWTWDANYVYVCTATNTWKRVALTGGY